MSARRSVIIHQTSAFVILLAETLVNYSAYFCWWECKVWFCPPVQGTVDTLLILTLWGV